MSPTNERPEIHGHRGCRGLLPENSIPGFLKATELGADFLEMDVVITADKQVLVSHEPWMRHGLCRTPDGTSITEDTEHHFNLYQMTLAEIQGYDCGSEEQLDFPDQTQQRTNKPSLREVIEAVDEHALMSGSLAPGFNIEIKSEPALYGEYQPRPNEFAELVLATIDSLGVAERCTIQSFDPAVLVAVHNANPQMELALLVENTDGLAANLQRLTFDPAIYSPHFTAVDAALVKNLHARGMRLAVWTVNEEADMRRMLMLGVDAIITDYPDRALRLLEDEP